MKNRSDSTILSERSFVPQRPPSRKLQWRKLYATALMAGPLYRWSLRRTPPPMTAHVQDIWPANTRQGRGIIEGHYTHYGETHPIQNIYSDHQKHGGKHGGKSGDRGWMESWHSFEWLRDVIAHDAAHSAAHSSAPHGAKRGAAHEAALGAKRGLSHARHRIREWITHVPPHRHIAWRADIVAQRIQSWLRYFTHLDTKKNDTFDHLLRRSIIHQAHHLSRIRNAQTPFEEAFLVFAGMACCSLTMPAVFARTLPQTLELCRQALSWQLRRDGCHYERSPRIHFLVLKNLIDLREYLHMLRHDIPPFLSHAITDMGRALASMCHPDGGLSLFNDSHEGEKPMILRALKLSSSLPAQSEPGISRGFQRLEAGSIHLLVDSGYPGELSHSLSPSHRPPSHRPPSHRHRHAGTASFEVSVGQERLIVNGGAFLGSQSDWRTYMRASSVHSTLIVNNTNSDWTGLHDSSLFRKQRSTPRALSHVTRHDEGGKIWLDIQHEGYRSRYALIHRRRFYLDQDDLRGEDHIEHTENQPLDDSLKVDIRFHLHPAIRAHLTNDGHAAILHTAYHGAWIFRVREASITLDQSVYVGSGFQRRLSLQLVARASINHGACCVKWALQPSPRHASPS